MYYIYIYIIVCILWEIIQYASLQQSAEDFLQILFTDCYLLADHAKRKTITPKDMLLAKRIRGDRCNWA